MVSFILLLFVFVHKYFQSLFSKLSDYFPKPERSSTHSFTFTMFLSLTEIRSAEKDFCVLGNPDNCPCPDIRPEDLPLPTLPSFDRVTTEAFSTEEVMTTLLTSTETPVVRVKGEETTLLPGINDTTDRQGTQMSCNQLTNTHDPVDYLLTNIHTSTALFIPCYL